MTNSEQMLSEMDSYLNEAASAEAEGRSALPFETLDDYIGDPSGFGDVTAKLWKKVIKVIIWQLIVSRKHTKSRSPGGFRLLPVTGLVSSNSCKCRAQVS